MPKKAASKKADKKGPQGALLKPLETDAKQLTDAERTKRLDAIYALEKKRDVTEVRLSSAAASHRAAKKAHAAACSDLEREIHDQRVGPGPLYGGEG